MGVGNWFLMLSSFSLFTVCQLSLAWSSYSELVNKCVSSIRLLVDVGVLLAIVQCSVIKRYH